MERFVFNVPGIGAVVVISSSMGLAKSQLQARFPGAAVEYSTNADRDPAMPNGHVGSSGKTLEQLLATSLFDPKIGQSGEIVADGRIVTGPSIGRDVASSGAATSATTGGNEIGVGAIGTLPAGFTRPPEDSIRNFSQQQFGDANVPLGSDLIDAPLERSRPFASFLRNLGQRGFESGFGRSLLKRQYDPARQTFLGENLLSGVRNPEVPAGTFDDFLTNLPGFAGLGGRARTAFGSIADLAQRSTREGPNQPGQTGPSGLSELQRIAGLKYARPDFDTAGGVETATDLANLARQSALSSFAPIIGNRLFGGGEYNPEALQDQFLAEKGTAGAGGADFANFLRSRFGQPVGIF
tara:strand:- start:47 stop:1105 length:1059 start_codon:yes stop_codon:yes gene_type:complete